MGTTQITVPSTGISIKGYSFDQSQLVSPENIYTMFIVNGGGSGNVLITDCGIEVSGTGSQVYNLTDATGFNAIECNRVNYNNCTSLGELNGYRQGLEDGTGRFGGTPNLILSGTWLGGFRIQTSIARSIDNSMTGSLFEAGTSFVMNSRFVSNINVDLGNSAGLLDFQPSNFNGSNILQLRGAEITRLGIHDPSDSTITPNISHTDTECLWLDNIGIYNTVAGGEIYITTETATSVGAVDTYYDLAGTWTSDNLQHFDSPSNGQLRLLDDSPYEFTVFGSITLVSSANNVVDLKIVIYRSETMSFEDGKHLSKQITNVVGSRDVTDFTISDVITLGENDYVKLQVENKTGANNITAALDSYLRITRR